MSIDDWDDELLKKVRIDEDDDDELEDYFDPNQEEEEEDIIIISSQDLDQKDAKTPPLLAAPFDQLTSKKRSVLAKKEARARAILAKAKEEEGPDEEELEEMLHREAARYLGYWEGEDIMATFEEEVIKGYDRSQKHVVYYQLPHHNYFLVPPKEFDEVHLSRLRILYTPLVGYPAITLYTYFYDECHLRFENEPNLGLTKAEIMQTLGMSIDDFYISISYLEQAGLLVHTLNERDPISSTFKLIEPLTPENFKKTSLYWHALVLRAGGKRAKLIRAHLKEVDPDYVIREKRPKRVYKARKPKLAPSPQHKLTLDSNQNPEEIPKEAPPRPSLWQDIFAGQYATPTKPKSTPKKPRSIAKLFKESIYKRNYEILEAYNKKILWILPKYEEAKITPIEMTPEIERAYELIRKTYPNIELTPQFALALLNDNEPFHHAGKLLGEPAHPHLDNCLNILKAEGFPKVSLNLITDYAFSQNGVININFVDKISKNFIEKGIYDPLSIAHHLRRATLLKAQLKVANAKKAAKNILENLQEASEIQLTEEEEKEVIESYETQYKYFDIDYQDPEEDKKKKKKKVIRQILKTGRRRRRK